MEKKSSKDLSEIYDDYHEKLLRYLRRLVGDQEAEEVCQSVFEKLNQKLGSFKGEAKLSTWLFRIATNGALDKLKSASFKHSSAGPLAPLPVHLPATEGCISRLQENKKIPDSMVIREEMSECIREFVDRLPPEYRTIIILSEINGFTNKEMAEILEISLDTAKIRLHRARARLKAIFEAGCDFYLDERSELACDRKQPIVTISPIWIMISVMCFRI